MKRLIYGGVSALAFAIAASSVGLPASARPAITTGHSDSSVPLVMSGETAMTFNFTAPFISSSGIRGNVHFIRLAVVGMSLRDLMVSIPSQMENYQSIRVINQTGQDIPAKISVDKRRVAVLFDQPIPQGSYVELMFTGVQMNTSGGDTLFYGVTAEREGITGEIPVGTARVHIPSRS
ncbi:DUF2808 domain-containing protein (plasmid) [Kovacikia minuta CCNUW1]|uniref:DUF2808 domain-containing protein n=1 Tax=Kovacikia minuta TaxID=2931930 RepID=UPI001CCBBA5F|nr:DUF2808 domain-containing protein [Kovacikia minuta]UBF30051.1 DUF2808 domain-containing protein [Kovacikia minuta CCNUW1]